MGPSSNRGANVSDVELGNRTETVLSGSKGAVLLWIGETEKRATTGMDQVQLASCCHYIISAGGTRLICFQAQALVL